MFRKAQPFFFGVLQTNFGLYRGSLQDMSLETWTLSESSVVFWKTGPYRFYELAQLQL